MPNPSTFKVYDASAGSGKTFTLVKEYLKLLFSSKYNDGFKQILAITFTNKAVGEMKARILEMLKHFSEPENLENPHTMFSVIVADLDIKPSVLQKKSENILNTIMHNYAAFDISTIDGFNHKLIRTFAHDLKIPINFEVELDTPSLLNQAVDSLIAKAGTDKKLTKILVDFALEKADDDKSWDVTRDFNTIAKLLTNENDLPHLASIKDKTLDDFNSLKSQLIKKIESQEQQLITEAKSALHLITENGLELSDFSGGKNAYLPSYFLKLKQLNLSIDFNTAWIRNLEEKPLYPAKVSSAIKSTIDSIQLQLIQYFKVTKNLVFKLKFTKAVYKNLTPLSVLNAINNELSTIKSDENKMLISEFNAIISTEIKHQPTPFIYERLGEKFRHYFIDEFQDTSEMQWANLIPLIDNALSGQNLKNEQGTAMIVGDAKQAIYRWRGGKAEQFIKLTTTNNPFSVEKTNVRLESNYRSFKNVVMFNNQFFDYLANQSFSSTTYSDLYKKAPQNQFIKEEGYVNFNFLDLEKEDDENEIYPETVFETINSCLTNGYQLKDICVLVRKKKQGVAIAEFLSEKGIRITSSETMLIDNSQEVKLVNNVLKLLVNPNNLEVRIKILDYLAIKNNIEDKHSYFKTHLELPITSFFNSFEAFNIYCQPSQLVQLSLYDMAESIVRSFNLTQTSNAYLQYFLDVVLEFSQKQISDVSGFLEYYQSKKDNLSIVSPSNQNAVQIMTIHKSKGLEFPVVIFPYAYLDIYNDFEAKEWFPLDEKEYNGFSKTLLNFNKDFENYGEDGEAIYLNHKAEQELDNINLLYVALTRPVEQLYIITKKEKENKDGITFKTYSGLFINYLISQNLWNDNQLEYTFGNQTRTILAKKDPETTKEVDHFISVAKQDHDIKIITKSGYLWDTNQQDAIEKGNLIHDIMADIKTEKEVAFVINDAINSGMINNEQASILEHTIKQILSHPELNPYYTEDYTIYNERDIISKTGEIIRPDRVVLKNNEAIIIDYKTGLPNPKYQQQLQHYADVLLEMNYNVTKKILIYINDTINVVTYI